MVSKVGGSLEESASRSNKKKYKKDAMDFVNFEEEFKKDPKFKTELCKTFTDTNFCAYGNKCRFAHGREELFVKHVNHPKYRKSDCLTFHAEGFCNYGQRCHFKHHELRKLDEIPRSYYFFLLNWVGEKKPKTRRLPIFCEVTGTKKTGGYNLKECKNLNNLKRMINLNVNFVTPKMPITDIKKKNASYAQKHFTERKSSDTSHFSRSPISLTSSSLSPDESLLQNKNIIHNNNLNKKLNFSNVNDSLFQ